MLTVPKGSCQLHCSNSWTNLQGGTQRKDDDTPVHSLVVVDVAWVEIVETFVAIAEPSIAIDRVDFAIDVAHVVADIDVDDVEAELVVEEGERLVVALLRQGQDTTLHIYNLCTFFGLC